ncbi:MAG TPA: 3',5'-cyclic-nucleotide phosphodiesterase [Candidatus Tectomicrobia bacterium]|nr:3',5'-cyclic-nucleotide phosphodiesterase [Candidatus Tectomicrobia bacterium]
MKIRVLGAFGAEGLAQRPAAFLVNDRVLLDAGTVGGALSVREQVSIEHALISHSHLDHVAGLVFLTETFALTDGRRPLTIASLQPVVDALRTSVFNDVAWPDFAQLPTPDDPIIRYRGLAEGVAQQVGDLWVTPVAVSHTVPTSGFIIDDGTSAVVFSGDTGPTQALWAAARAARGIRAVILECAFPNRLAALADVARHLTPALVQRELDKVPPNVPVWIYHVKPQFADEIADELAAVGDPRVMIVEQDKTYFV